MKLFPSLLKATRMTREGRPVSALLALRKAILAPPAKAPKRARPAAKTAKPAARAATIPETQAPGSFTGGHFVSRHGARDYRLHTPRGPVRGAPPLLVMLHGCTQDSADFAIATGMNDVADECGFLVLYPEQPRAANAGRCWNWHRPADQARGAGEPALIAALTRRVAKANGADPARIYIAGLSAGGAAAAIIGAAYPDLFAAVGVHSGLARGTVSTVSGALQAMRHGSGVAMPMAGARRPLPLILFHGDEDKVVNPVNADGFLAGLRHAIPTGLVAQTQSGQAAGGRAVTRTLHSDATGEVLLENWIVHGSGHGWSGGRAGAAHTDPAGPDASREMARFFLARRRVVRKRATRTVTPAAAASPL